MVQSHDDSLHVDGVHRVAGDDSLVPLQGSQQVKETKWIGMKGSWSSQCQAVHCFSLCPVHLLPPCWGKAVLVEKCRRHRPLSFASNLPPCLSVQKPGIWRSGPHAVFHSLGHRPAVPCLEKAGDDPSKLLFCSSQGQLDCILLYSLEAFFPSSHQEASMDKGDVRKSGLPCTELD